MEKYKKLLEKIICEKQIQETDFVSIDDILFNEKGITVNYEYYPYSNSSETKINSIEIYNSELNTHIYETIN